MPDRMSGAEDLLARARGGDAAAFERLVLIHEKMVARTAYRIMNDSEAARDIAQETFLRLYRNLKRLDIEPALAAWLYRVTVNLCRDALRARREWRELDDRQTSSDPSPETLTRLGQRRDMLESALAELPARERMVVVLREIEGLSATEVAAIMGTTEGTVRSQAFSARAKLKRLLSKWMGRDS